MDDFVYNAYGRMILTKLDWVRFSLVCFIVSLINFMGVVAELFLVYDISFQNREEFLYYWILVSGILALITTVVIVKKDSTKFLEFMKYMKRDYRWDKKFRLIPYYLMIFGSIMVTLIVIWLMSGYIIFASWLITKTIEMITNINKHWYPFILSSFLVGFAILIFVMTRSVSKKNRERKERYERYSTQVEEYKTRPTVFSEGFIGFTNGSIVEEKTGITFQNRSGGIEEIVYLYPFLLARDSKNDVFMWERKTKWIFHGMMERIDGNLFHFNKFVSYRLRVDSIQYLDPYVIFEMNGEYYLTEDLSPSLKFGRKIKATNFLLTVVDGQVLMPIQQSDGILLPWLDGKEYKISDIPNPVRLEVRESIFVLSSNKLKLISRPLEMRTIFEYQTEGTLSCIPSDSEFFVVKEENVNKQKMKNFVHFIAENRRFKIQLPKELGILAYASRHLYVYENNTLFKIKFNSLWTIERNEFNLTGIYQE